MAFPQKLRWKARLVERGFPDRSFDIEFWQEQGDDAIFAAAWDLMELAEEPASPTNSAKSLAARKQTTLTSNKFRCDRPMFADNRLRNIRVHQSSADQRVQPM